MAFFALLGMLLQMWHVPEALALMRFEHISEAQRDIAWSRGGYPLYDAFGNQTSITDPMGRITEFSYDGENRQISRQLPIGVAAGDTSFTESMEYYDATNAPAREYYGLLEQTTDFEGRITRYTYDEFGRVQTTTYTNGTTSRTITNAYDALGRLHTVTDSTHGTTTHTYDAEGRLKMAAAPEGVIAHEYDPGTGQLTRTYTPEGVTDTEYVYDALGRLTDVIAKKRFSGGVTETTSYAYDAAGTLDYELGASGLTKDHVYDTLGRLIELNHFADTDGDRT